MHDWFWAAYVAVGLLYWLAMFVCTLRAVRAVPVLRYCTAQAPPRWPRVSQIVPACNEADTLEPALRSRLADGYPETEIILVEDRSTDETPVIADRLAAADPRVRVIHIRELPPDWLGKVNALHTGYQAATGEWLLFSDADVHLAPGALQQAVAFALAHNADHLALFPDLWSSTFWLDANLTSFLRVFAVVTRCWAVPNPRSGAFIGVGAFNLVRRAAFERTPGFEWLRLEVVDDMGLGLMLKRAGGRSLPANGSGLIGLHFYKSLAAAARGMEKSVPGGLADFSLSRAVVQVGLFVALESAPFVAALLFGRPWLQLAGAAGIVVAWTAQLLMAWRLRRPIVSALFIPIAALVSAYAALRATWLARQRGGIDWRGTRYPTDLLRAGRRVRFW